MCGSLICNLWNKRVQNGTCSTKLKFPIRNSAPKVNSVAPKVNSVAPKVNSVAPKVNSVATKVNSVAPKVNSVATKVNSVAPKVNSVAPKVNSVATKVNSVIKISSRPACHGNGKNKKNALQVSTFDMWDGHMVTKSERKASLEIISYHYMYLLVIFVK